jgi:uncharacterized protein YbaR (Trm112 family)
VKRTLLGLMVCPRCRERFALDVFREDTAPCDTEREVLDGALRCTRCAAAFPVVAGVPRLLAPALLAQVRTRHPRFFADHPQFLTGQADGDDPLADTLESFTRQRLDLDLPGPALAAQWRVNLQRNLGQTLALGDLRGRRILDVGCGFGRHGLVASDHGARTVTSSRATSTSARSATRPSTSCGRSACCTTCPTRPPAFARSSTSRVPTADSSPSGCTATVA